MVGRGRRQISPSRSIAFARRLFEAWPIENLNCSPAVADKASRLHGLSGERHRFAIRTQDMCEELVSVRQKFAFGSIMHHQEPPAHSFFGRMHGIACDRLLHLRQQRLRIADEQVAHVFAVLEFGLQYFDRASDRAALQLHYAPIERDPAVHSREEAECSFTPYVSGLDSRAILQNG
jgi:hypothetical protein